MSLECVPLSAYCRMTGETAEQVKSRVKTGEWRLGTQVLKVPGSKEWWVDLIEVNLWVRRYVVPLTDKELGINWKALDDDMKRKPKRPKTTLGKQ